MKAKSFTLSFALLTVMGLTLLGCLEKSEDPDKKKREEAAIIDAYLTASGTHDVIYDNSTYTRFVVDHYGDGPPPAQGQTIQGVYTAGILLPSGTIEPFSVGASGSVNDNLEDISPSGLAYIYSVLLEGSEATVYLPSDYGYGAAGNDVVPPNSILVYHVKLNKVVPTTVQLTQFKLDTAAISFYISENEIDATKLRSGMWYKIDEPGTGNSPIPYSLATFDYKLSTLATNGTLTQIQTGTLTDAGIFGLINGLRIGMPLMQTGGKTTFYIPSLLGYGAAGSSGGGGTSIPANANLVFEITLKSFQ